MLLGIVISAVVGLIELASCSTTNRTWESFKISYERSYSSGSREDLLRRAIFERNKRDIERFNTIDGPERMSYTRGLNQFSDFTNDELDLLLLSSGQAGTPYTPMSKAEAEKFFDLLLGDRSEPLPESVDWRLAKPARVTEVKYQQLCGCSWAFAATGILEGQQLHLTRGERLISLSEQNLLDCASSLGGCNGSAWTQDALEFVSKQNGIESQDLYPFTALPGKCKFQRDRAVMSTKGPVLLPEGDEQTLKEVVAKYGPVGIRVEVTKNGFFMYLNGVFKDNQCRNQAKYLQHSMLIVGYGTDTKQGDYWLVKNQWSKDWGEHGYIRMARNHGNMCGLATRAVIATF